jgi:hypothetical protein
MLKLLTLIFIAFMFQGRTAYCGCGDFESGITHYEIIVKEGRGCCTSETIGEYGFFDSYVYDDGAWHWIERSLMSPSQAQKNCCESA